MMGRHLAGLGLFGLLTVGCSRMHPTVVPQSASVYGADLGGVIVRTEMQVYNPNGFRLRLNDITGSITLANQVPLGTATVPTGIELPGQTWQHVVADLKLPWLNLPGAIAIANLQPVVPFSFDGHASIGGKLRVTVPFRIEGQVPATELLRAGMPFPLGSPAPAPTPWGGWTPLLPPATYAAAR